MLKILGGMTPLGYTNGQLFENPRCSLALSAFLRFIVTGGMLERTAFLCFVISHVVVTSELMALQHSVRRGTKQQVNLLHFILLLIF